MTAQTLARRGTVRFAELLEFAIEHANDGIAIMKFTGDPGVPIRIVYANKTIEQFSGFTREELLDPSNPFLRAQPQNRARYDELLREIRAGNPVRFEIELGGKDRATWTEIRWSPLRYSKGVVTHYVAVLRDISKGRGHGEQLALFQSILSETSDFILTADGTRPSEGGPRITFANPAFAALAGLEPERVVGRSLVDFFSPHNPENVLPNIIARLEHREGISHELRVRHFETDRDIWIELSGHHVRNEGGRSSSWFFVGKDISVRKHGHMQTAQLITALDLAEEPIVIYDVVRPLELEMQHMNERAADYERPLLEQMLLDPRQRERIESAWPALEDGKSVNRLVYVGESDVRRWVTLEIRPMRSGRGPVGSIIAIEHGLQINARDGLPDSVSVALLLGREILRYTERSARRDAFLEVLRNEWGAKGSFSPTAGEVDVVLRVKDRNGYAVMPPGVIFERRGAVNFGWSDVMSPRQLTSLRIFLETLARSE
ncbi:MAG TPA: PAS domain-containing protein [Candidatus Baltobacteraceae bacterium]|nr:PAS domain-containing protein [Candidatus Baltobacteraceae bacterium]